MPEATQRVENLVATGNIGIAGQLQDGNGENGLSVAQLAAATGNITVYSQTAGAEDIPVGDANRLGVVIQPASDGVLGRVEFNLRRVAGAATVDFEVFAVGSDGQPTGVALQEIADVDVDTGYAAVGVDFSSAAQALVAGTRYWAGFENDSGDTVEVQGYDLLDADDPNFSLFNKDGYTARDDSGWNTDRVTVMRGTVEMASTLSDILESAKVAGRVEVGTVATTDATETTVLEHFVPPAALEQIDFEVQAGGTVDNWDRDSYFGRAAVYRPKFGDAILLGSAMISDFEADTDWNVLVDTTGDAVRIRVVGDENDIDWEARMRHDRKYIDNVISPC